MDDMEMIVSFADQSTSFVLGYEAGLIAQRMMSCEAVIDYGMDEGFPIHTDNLEIIRRLCAAYSYTLETQATCYSEWVKARMTHAASVKPILAIVRGDDP